MSNDEVAALSSVKPSARQLSWQALEFYAFIHFGMNTMTDREWGLGHEDPALFDPDELDVDQWMRAALSAGMTGVILTAKHHDGFCLWPSKVTGHTVAASPWRDGTGDLLGEVADSARRHGLSVGIYLSPWDRTESSYGSGRAYDDFFIAQLTEVLTQYGPIFSVWFDGANGEGPDGRVQTYDWDRYYAVIRRLQPGAVISVCGPDVRWCGNEAGHTRADEWSVVPGSLRDAERIAEQSQQVDDGVFATLLRSNDDDLGSRDALKGKLDDLVWYPAEVNTSIRPGWFHHPSEDQKVRSADELFQIWCSSAGGNATFLLNIPPTARGLVADPDMHELQRLGQLISDFRARTIPAALTPSSTLGRDGQNAAALSAEFGPTPDRTWQPDPLDPHPTIAVRLPEARSIEAVVLSEDIRLGQRLEHVTVHADTADGLVEVARARSIGYRRILRFDTPVVTDRLSVALKESRGTPALVSLATIESPVEHSSRRPR